MHGHHGGDVAVAVGKVRDGFGAEIEGFFVDIGQQRRGARTEDRAHRGEEAERGGDHEVSGADMERGQGQPEGVRAAGAADRVGNFAGGGC